MENIRTSNDDPILRYNYDFCPLTSRKYSGQLVISEQFFNKKMKMRWKIKENMYSLKECSTKRLLSFL